LGFGGAGVGVGDGGTETGGVVTVMGAGLVAAGLTLTLGAEAFWGRAKDGGAPGIGAEAPSFFGSSFGLSFMSSLRFLSKAVTV
jgi:hypothetical protein